MGNPFEKPPRLREDSMEMRNCPKCNGRGTVESRKCEGCNGRGRIPKPRA